MHLSRTRIALIASVFVTSTLHADDADKPPFSTSRILSVIDTVLDNHIDPPTRQQMVLFGAKLLYQAHEKPIPIDLSRRISRLSTDEEMFAYLESLNASFPPHRKLRTDNIIIGGLLRAVPGGSVLIDAEQARVQNQLAANRYVGIGIALAMKNNLPIISKVFYDGPGFEAGVKADDSIVQIDGRSTAKKDLVQIVKELRGAEGSNVVLTLKQEQGEQRELTVTRGVTFIPTIEGSRQLSEGQWDYKIDSVPGIALLRIKSIGPSTVHELKKIEAKLRGQGIRGIVFDLREGGGILHDVVLLADQLLEEGTIGHVKTIDSLVTHRSEAGSLFNDIPIAVLISRYSNADRVYLTAALQDRGRAVVIGEPTSGETYVKSHVEIPGGEQLLLATGLLQRSDGTTLLRTMDNRLVEVAAARKFASSTKADSVPVKKPSFIMPDHVVRIPLPNEGSPPQGGIDPMLEKAIAVLQETATQTPVDATSEQVSTR